MGTFSNAPESKESTSYETSPTPRWIFVVFVIAFALVGYALYAGYETRTKLESALAQEKGGNTKLLAQLDQTNARLAELKGQVEVTSQKIGLTQAELARARSLAQTIRKEQQESDAKLLAELGQVKQTSEAKISQVSSELGGAKSDIEATRKDLEATKMKLDRAIGDLGVQSGLIAHNREELETVKRLGERNIYEFDLRKSKTPQRVGPVQLTLVKADPKKFRYTLNVYADDKRIEKKDRTVNEPVQFYVKGARGPYEVVVFEVAKDRATGYLSTPKESPPSSN